MRPRVAAIFVQSSVLSRPLRMSCIEIVASAAMSRIAISLLPISREKKIVGMRRLHARLTREVERERRLAHRGARADDDHLPRVEAVRQLVELAEAGGHPGQLAVTAGRGLHLVDGDGDRLGQRRVVLGGGLARDAEHLRLRLVQQVHRVALGLVAHLRDVRARLDEPAQDGLLGDDLGVVAGVGGGRHDVGERVEVGLAAGPLHVAGARELVADRDRVGRLAPGVEAQDRPGR